MAEAFGVVASALAVAELTAKFGVSLFKLKQLWNEVQDVPESINRTLRQLELVRPVIAELEAVLLEQTGAAYHGSTAYSSIQACSQIVDEMETLAVELQSQIASAKRSRRSLAKLKVSFKRESIQDHHERLRFILDLVSISQMTCMIHRKDCFRTLTQMDASPLQRRPNTKKTTVSMQTSMMIADQLLNGDKSQYRHAVKRSQSLESLNTTQHHILSIQASKYASFRGHFEMIKHLLSMGLSLRETRNDGGAPIHDLWALSTDLGEVMRLYRYLLWNNLLDDPMQELFIPQARPDTPSRSFAHMGLFGIMWKFVEFREAILRDVGVNYYELALSVRFDTLSWYCVDPTTLINDLTYGNVQPVDFRAASRHRRVLETSLSGFAMVYASETPFFNVKDPLFSADPRTTTEENLFASWRQLARWLFRDMPLEELTGKESGFFQGVSTPLLDGMCYFFQASVLQNPPSILHKRDNMRQVRRFSKSWVEDVQSAGIDLTTYGERELDLLVRNDHILTSRWCSLDIGHPSDGYPLSGPRLVSFTYGPRPEDWELVWDPAAEEFAGDFWNLVEDRPLPMPGAWEEDG
ncbi:hypothetical protein CMUS01_04059 [Colletotrichum musicola]|uniref:Fungal N-terminal domain-containing protein n=1 Tax=Colletotrichum musicola TaxID=2175873 RepID=A0A8H6NP64_9PEZI|nr:hypothetical protein CMUS01_04059 [Colletotrichum musicola]